MRVNIVNQGTGAGGGFDIAGATLTGPLILADDPKVAMEAATKRYIDVAVNSLNAGHIVTGTLPVGRLPAFSGDLSNVAGTNNFTLSNTTVTPGTYTKVTVDAKGRVTAGTGLTAADIPALSWSKITTNKPTTVDGYGITDAVKSTTDNMTGPLTLHAHPTAASHAATKGYVDTTASSSAVLATGDTIRRTNSTTPTGFLRCNGGVVSKTTYSALYNVIAAPYQTRGGIDYTSYSAMGAGRPWEQQYDINYQPSADFLSSWTAGTAFPMRLRLADAIVTKNRVYVLGGWMSNGAQNIIYTAPIDASGVLGAWSNVGNLPTITQGYRVVTTKNYAYIIGGIYDISSNPTNWIYRAAINADGTLGSWTTHNTTLPAFVSSVKTFITKNRIYVIAQTKVYAAPIDTNGLIGTWTTEQTDVNYGFTDNNYNGSQPIVTKNRVYLFSCTGNVTEFAYATINDQGVLGTVWTRGTNLNQWMGEAKVFVLKNTVYLLGGTASSTGNAHMLTYSAVINADGSLGTWTQRSSLNSGVFDAVGFLTSSRMYLIGGWDNGVGPNDNVQWASYNGITNDYSPYYNGMANKFDGSNISGDIVLSDTYSDSGFVSQPGSGQPWRQQYDINTAQSADISSWAGNTGLPATVHAAQAVVTKNRVYLLGGSNNSPYSNVVYTAPINSDGTLGSWTTDNPLPAALGYSQAVVTKNRVYLLGGVNSGASAVNVVYTAPINTDGTLGAWTTGTSLPTNLNASCAIVTTNRVYLIGGQGTGGYSAAVYTAVINDNGTLGDWTTSTNPLPQGVSVSQAVVTKSRVYLCGGYNSSGYSSTVYTAVIAADGVLGAWSTSASLPGVLGYSQAVTVRNRVYLFGGGGASGATNVTYTAPINADGTLGAWSTGTPIPSALYVSQSVVTNSRVYLIGGMNSTGMANTVFVAYISGGLNDYSGYYNGTFTVVTPDSFSLPDTTATDPANIFTFIKY